MRFGIIFIIFFSLLAAANGQGLTGEVFFESEECLGNVAVTKSAHYPPRYFYTVHPESKPKTNKLYEIVDGIKRPYPTAEFQEKLKNLLGLYIDLQNRLWVIDHGFYGRKEPKILCFDLVTNQLVLEYVFNQNDTKEVLKNTMLNDLTVDPEGNFVYISAPSLFKKHSSIIVFDVKNKTSQRILENHPSVTRKKYVAEVDGKKMRFILGLYKVRPGVDGIDISPDGNYLYYTAMSHDSLYRLDLSSDSLIPEKVLERPICDGIRVDEFGNIYITDVENHQILKYAPKGRKSVVFRNPEADWVDGLSIGARGYLYVTDSKLQHVMFKKPKRYKEHLPFKIWRVKIGSPLRKM